MATAVTGSEQKRPSRAVLTLAMGPSLYLELACNLARSFLHWHGDGAISFQIVTDRPAELPPDLRDVKLLVVSPGRFGSGFSPKLWLDQLVSSGENLFIDSDCLCFGRLDAVFDRLSHQPVTVIGEERTSGQFFGDIPALRQALNLPWVPVFVGCVYYVAKGDAASAVYAEARRLEAGYDQLGLVRLRGVPNEEPLMALAMARHGLRPVADDGTIKADAMCYRRIRRLDVLKGEAAMDRPLSDKSLAAEAHPVLIHFNSYYTEGPDYRRECARLRWVRLHGWPAGIATVAALLRYDLPLRSWNLLKNLLRPLHRRLFGSRSVRSSLR